MDFFKTLLKKEPSEQEIAQEKLQKAGELAYILNTTCDFYVFVNSFKEIVYTLESLIIYEPKGFFTNSIPSQDLTRILEKRSLTEKDFINRYISHYGKSSLRQQTEYLNNFSIDAVHYANSILRNHVSNENHEKYYYNSIIRSSFPINGYNCDAYLVEVAEYVIQNGSTTISDLQKKFKIGFNHASRIIDQLKEIGVITNGTPLCKARISMTEFEECLTKLIDHSCMVNSELSSTQKEFSNVKINQSSEDHEIDMLAEKEESSTHNVTLYFTNGQLVQTDPINVENHYACHYFISDGIKYDLKKVSDIKSIKIPTFGIIDSFNKYGSTGSIDYILRMKAAQYFNSDEKELCSACLWKSTELMLANKFYAWSKSDFERLIIWHYKMNMFSEGKKAQKYLEKNGVYNNQFDSFALSIKDSVFKSLKQFNIDLVAFHDCQGGTCAECAKMIGRVYSVTGKDKRFPQLPEYVKEHGNFHNGCRCTMTAYFEEEKIFHHGKMVNALKTSNRPYVDDRTDHEINSYQSYLNYLLEIEQKEKDRKEYYILLENIPNITPKSFGAYRRMKKSKTKTFEKLFEIAKQNGIEIEIY